MHPLGFIRHHQPAHCVSITQIGNSGSVVALDVNVIVPFVMPNAVLKCPKQFLSSAPSVFRGSVLVCVSASITTRRKERIKKPAANKFTTSRAHTISSCSLKKKKNIEGRKQWLAQSWKRS